jgi:hypothetical protein
MLCPASAAAYHARPELAFVQGVGVPSIELSVAWRTDDTDVALLVFLDYIRGAAPSATEV